MKRNKTLHLSLFLLACLAITGCGSVKKYHASVAEAKLPITNYTCEMKGEVIRHTVVELKSEDLKKCVDTKEKLLWIRYWVPYCGENSQEVELAKKYADKVELVWVALLWDYETVKKQMEMVPYPIYYIDRSLPKHRAKAAAAFTNQMITNKRKGPVKSNVFIRNGELIYDCHSGVSDELLAQFTRNLP